MNTERDAMLRTSAYHKWESEGRPEGQRDKHWRDAESEFSTVGDEELADKGKPKDGVPTASSELPKVGEFSSAK